MVAAFKSFRRSELDAITIGTMCSGCDIAVWIAKLLSEHWYSEWGIAVPFDHIMSCDNDPHVQAHILQTSPGLSYLFADVRELGKTRAYNLVTKSTCVVPFVCILIAGFVCTSRSKLNKNSKHNTTCVEDGTGNTGITFEALFAYIALALPKMVILENVMEILNECEYIITKLKSIGYAAVVHVHASPTDYGSMATRNRKYFVAWRVPTESSLPHKFGQYIEEMKVPSFPAERFLLDDAVLQADEIANAANAPIHGSPKRQKIGDQGKYFKYKEEHIDYYNGRELVWPPMVDVEMPYLRQKSLTRRQVESIFYLHMVFMKFGQELVVPEFVDANMSLKWLAGGSVENPTNPW